MTQHIPLGTYHKGMCVQLFLVCTKQYELTVCWTISIFSFSPFSFLRFLAFHYPLLPPPRDFFLKVREKENFILFYHCSYRSVHVSYALYVWLLWYGPNPSCRYMKDLSMIEGDLANVLIIDNSSSAYELQPANAVPILSWFDDPLDEELLVRCKRSNVAFRTTTLPSLFFGCFRSCFL